MLTEILKVTAMTDAAPAQQQRIVPNHDITTMS